MGKHDKRSNDNEHLQLIQKEEKIANNEHLVIDWLKAYADTLK